MGKNLYFDNEKATKLTLNYIKSIKKGNPDYSLRNNVLEMSIPLVRGLLNSGNFYKLLPHFEDMDDVVQEGCLKIIKDLHMFSPKRGSLFNFLCKIVKHHVLTYITKKRKITKHEITNIKNIEKVVENFFSEKIGIKKDENFSSEINT